MCLTHTRLFTSVWRGQVQVTVNGKATFKMIQADYNWTPHLKQAAIGLQRADMLSDKGQLTGAKSMQAKIKAWVDGQAHRWGGLHFNQHNKLTNTKPGQACGYTYKAAVLLPPVADNVSQGDELRGAMSTLNRAVQDKSEWQERMLYIKVTPWHTTCNADVELGGRPDDWILYFLQIGINPTLLQDGDGSDMPGAMEDHFAKRCAACACCPACDSGHIMQAGNCNEVGRFNEPFHHSSIAMSRLIIATSQVGHCIAMINLIIT